MRSSRLLAASTLLALSLGATVGTTSAVAVSVSPSPTATATPSATASASPSATTSATASTTASPSASATARPTGRPTVPVPTPTATDRCHGGVYQSKLLKTTGTGLFDTTLVKGGPAAEVSVVFENKSGVDLPVIHHGLYVTDEFDTPVGPNWSPEFFDVQVNTGSGWKAFKLTDRNFSFDVAKLAKGEKFTVQLRIAATAKAPVGRYGSTIGGGSDAFDNDKVPTPANNKANACTQFIDYYEGDFQVADAGTAPTTKAPSAPAPAGPQLAQTGSSSDTVPIAVGGATVLAVGAGTLFVLRRRKAGSHG
ncbi:LAETG motif-containing sortase-dependent surface protein [Kitasatospora sp. NPDC047058]|uniref:LAETG motif-containing sortase-dependent surface protein n=1 Tax=Kitasatospora sp. NPDC047058 TaxID=3155620 RepID=UPI0033C2FDE9